MSRISWACVFLLLVVLADVVALTEFSYKHYHYNRKHRLAKQLKTKENECDSQCQQQGNEKDSVEHVSCSRLCVSAECYQELYAFNELEPGEIDLRDRSFKGCVLEQMNAQSRAARAT
eukprot:m.244447 g.244447  ORF g.244447 m.244447 type:complete len:118 (+) comp31019_c0_seq1:1-354(+)